MKPTTIAKAPSVPPAAEGRSRIVWRIMATSIALVAFLILSPGSLLVLGVGLMPTVVAFVIDRSPRRHATATVGGINFAAVFHFLIPLWLAGGDLHAATRTLTDPVALAAMYLAAAAGWGLYIGVPPIICAVRRASALQKVRQLKAQQRKLTQEWGKDISRRPA